MRFLVHIFSNTTGNLFARHVLSIIKSVQFKPSRALGIFTYAKVGDRGYEQGERDKGGTLDGEEGTEI